MTPTQTDVLIIGAGPAGSAAAAIIAKAGYQVIVAEQKMFPRFVIGESLLPRSMDLLESAGLLDAVNVQGYMVKKGAVFLREEEKADFDFSNQFTKGWDHTFQVPRDHFDENLIKTTEKLGATVLWEKSVQKVAFYADHSTVTLTDNNGMSEEIQAKFILDGSGYGRVLPRLLDLDTPSDLPLRESIFTHVTGDKRPSGDEEGKIWIVVVGHQAWAWVIPFSNGKTSIGIVANPDFYNNYPGGLDKKLTAIISANANLSNRLSDAEFVFPTQRISGYSTAVKQFYGDGYALLGNATEFLDPVFSSGVTLALESSVCAANLVVRQLKGEAVDWETEYAQPLMKGVDVFRTYVNAWYDGRLPEIFFTKNQPEPYKAQICSVLAGYVWDDNNTFVADAERAVTNLAKLCKEMNSKGSE